MVYLDTVLITCKLIFLKDGREVGIPSDDSFLPQVEGFHMCAWLPTHNNAHVLHILHTEFS